VNKWLVAIAMLATLSGCASNPQGSVPVVDNGASVRDEQVWMGGRPATPAQQAIPSPAVAEQDAGVVVMVPDGASGSVPMESQSFPAQASPSLEFGTEPIVSGTYSPPITSSPAQPATPSGIPSARSGGLAADEQLDGPVLALLTSAQQLQRSGDLNGAASSLERAQRIAPREPQVLYRLAELRLAQGDAAQAEQVARRALTYAADRPALQASLWNLIAQARERQGDPAGAAQARERARVSS
jgi:hypothetical protein